MTRGPASRKRSVGLIFLKNAIKQAGGLLEVGTHVNAPFLRQHRSSDLHLTIDRTSFLHVAFGRLRLRLLLLLLRPIARIYILIVCLLTQNVARMHIVCGRDRVPNKIVDISDCQTVALDQLHLGARPRVCLLGIQRARRLT